MQSAFGVEHGVSKGLRPRNLRALERVGRGAGSERAQDYANLKLGLRYTGRAPARTKRMMAMTTKPLEKKPLP